MKTTFAVGDRILFADYPSNCGADRDNTTWTEGVIFGVRFDGVFLIEYRGELEVNKIARNACDMIRSMSEADIDAMVAL